MPSGMSVLEDIKRRIKARGGSTVGLNTISDAVKRLDDIDANSSSGSGLPEPEITKEYNLRNYNFKTYSYFETFFIGAISFISGESYRVLFDNEEYNCVAYDVTMNDETTTFIGNKSFITESVEDDTNEPFSMKAEPVSMTAVNDSDDTGVYTLLTGVSYTRPGWHSVSVYNGNNTIFEDKLISIQDEDSEPPVIEIPYRIDSDLIPGDEYKVVFNGEEYACIAKANEEAGITYLGDFRINPNYDLSSYTDEPFCIHYDGASSKLSYIHLFVFNYFLSDYSLSIYHGDTVLVENIDFSEYIKPVHGYVPYRLIDPTPEDLVFGTEYKVIFNGEEYTCVSDEIQEMYGLIAVGNERLILGTGTGSGEPFFVLFNPNSERLNGDGIYVAYNPVGISDYSLEIYKETSSLKPGMALVWNGSEWSKETGYGYTDSNDEVVKFDTKFIPNALKTYRFEGIINWEQLSMQLDTNLTPEDFLNTAFIFHQNTGSSERIIVLKAAAINYVFSDGLIGQFSISCIADAYNAITFEYTPSTGILQYSTIAHFGAK